MPRAAFRAVHELALDQFGYVTTEQVRDAGIAPGTLWRMAKRGVIERIDHGLYRDTLIAPTAHDTYFAATLWPRGVQAVLSHETALELLELSDANPTKVHLTVPVHHRIRRDIPRTYVIHQATLPAKDVMRLDGLPITTPARTIRDCHSAHVNGRLLRQAVDDGLRTGRLTHTEADALRRELTVTPSRLVVRAPRRPHGA